MFTGKRDFGNPEANRVGCPITEDLNVFDKLRAVPAFDDAVLFDRFVGVVGAGRLEPAGRRHDRAALGGTGQSGRHCRGAAQGLSRRERGESLRNHAAMARGDQRQCWRHSHAAAGEG